MASTLKVQIKTIISESKKLKVHAATCTFNRRHNWTRFVGQSTLIQPKYLAGNLCVNEPGQKWLNRPPSNLSGLTTFIRTYSLTLVWINHHAGEKLLKISWIIHQCLVRKTDSDSIQLPISVSFSLIQPQFSPNLEANPIIWLHRTSRTYWQ